MMQNDEKQNAAPAPLRDGSDNNRPLDSQCVRHVLRHVSEVLRKHAEILASFEAKNPTMFCASWDATARLSQNTKQKIRYEKYTKLS
jgi:hypothetical protein